MSNPMLQSDAASALLATINESANTQRNDFVYSETANVVPYQSVQWENVMPSSVPGTITGGSTIHFDVPKMGILTKAVCSLTFNLTDTVAPTSTVNQGALKPNPFLNCINEITLSSAGRTISRLTTAGIMARISEKTNGVKQGYVDALGLTASAANYFNFTSVDPATGATPVAGGNVHYPLLLNLDMFFQENKYALQTNFLQPARISISFNNPASSVISTSSTLSILTTGGIGYDGNLGPTMYLQYRNLSDPVDQATIQANYADGLLSQIVENMSYENPLNLGVVAANAVHEVIIPLKDTSCIECAYIYVQVDPADAAPVSGLSSGSTGICCPVEIAGNIVFRANGTNFIDIPARLLKYYGIQSQLGRDAFGSSKHDTGDLGNTQNIYCLDFTSGMVGSNVISNLLSMRELSNPEIRFQYTPVGQGAGKVANAYVCYCRRELATTISNTGRYSISLSN